MNNKNESASIKEVLWKNHKAVQFSAGGYEALIVPEVGANVIEFRNTIKEVSILRSPNDDLEFEEFKSRPQVYGLPVLFPPNRIEDGKFKVGDKVYQFPINEPKNHNYIHGFIKNDRWQITKKEIISKGEVEIEAVFNFNKEHSFYKYLPHEFQFKLIYNLSNKGLKQTTSITNLSDKEMPIGIGYHTAFNVPFHEESKDEDYRIIASIGKRWVQDERNLPTEEILDLTEKEKQYVNKGIIPLGYKIESHYTLKNINVDGSEFHGAIIEDISKKLRVVYEMGKEYKHMVIWNDMGDKHYVCIEPQTCVINAPNINLDDNITGFKTLAPKDTWKESAKIYVEDFN
ncbi:aldose 1-epimerase [Clostridium sp. P21]|uniref:Aldose 1-epimerase n=1 Tax=Clostridium muellerianum TaxID=2716538 RepID=A0A7Y0EIA6_9CLOT|nr:aldose 1-epimerase [Clostridium muellerianum]NMM63979.1 aldose 1-epimerase [Clostridium muellerianum]